MDSFHMYDQLVQDCRKFRHTFKVFVFFLDAGQCATETRLSLYIITHGEIDIAQFDLADSFLQSVLCALFDTQFIILYGICRIFPVQVNISEGIINLIQIILILIALRHALKHLDYLLIVSA